MKARVPLGYALSALAALVPSLLATGVAWGQNVQTNIEQDRRINALEDQSKALQKLTAQQVAIQALMQQQQKTLDTIIEGLRR